MPATDEKTALLPGSAEFPWPTLPVDHARLQDYLDACRFRGIGYGLGAKADGAGRPLLAFPPRYPEIDCSGWVRAALGYATGGGVIPPDGSVCQHEWIAARGFKASRVVDLLLKDGVLRIAFIAPNTRHPVGHVYLCRDGRTLESYGGHGPGSRSPLAHVLHALTTDVYVLTKP